MTLPSLIAKHQEKVTITRLKKVYSVLSQLYLTVTNEAGDPSNWAVVYDESDNRDGTMTFYNVLKNYTKYLTICDQSSCTGDYKLLTGSVNNNSSYRMGRSIVFADGTFLRAGFGDSAADADGQFCNLRRGNSEALKHVCAELYVDINGSQLPNTFGRDAFLFYWTKYGIVPVGSKDESSHLSFSTCSKNDTGSNSGYGCAAWVLVNENMDYMHCDGLSWTGKKTCK